MPTWQDDKWQECRLHSGTFFALKICNLKNAQKFLQLDELKQKYNMYYVLCKNMFDFKKPLFDLAD